MTKIFFVDEQHEKNYKKMAELFPAVLSSKEYQAACYIHALPMIFYKFEYYINDFSSPVEWIYRWEEQQFFDILEDVELEYDLSSSMLHLGRLALNLWNGYEHFNLMDCLNNVDDENFLVVKQAIEIRMKGIHCSE